MSKEDIILKVSNISKQYRLGLVGTGTISHDLNRWWSKLTGKEDPYLKIGEINDRSKTSKSDYVWALKDIDFELKRGEVLGIIGKNGAGKSTLLKILSRVTSPTTGEIQTKGRIASLLEVGTGFHPEMTGRENIYLNGAILGMTKAEIRSKIDEIIDFSGCERYIDTPVKRYSSGMTVRLAFSVAAHLEPDILVVDEVLAVGDAEFQKKAIGKMQDVSKGQGRTVLFVSHNMVALKKICSRAILLNNGTIFSESDNVNKIVSEYLSLNTKAVNDSYILQKEKVSGNCDLIVKNVKVNGTNIFQVSNTDVVTLDFEIENASPRKGVLEFAGSIKDKDENYIHYFSSKLKGKQYFVEPKTTFKSSVTFDRFNVQEGDYFFTLELKFNDDIVFLYPNAFVLKIVNNDFYSSGVVWQNGLLLINQKWK